MFSFSFKKQNVLCVWPLRSSLERVSKEFRKRESENRIRLCELLVRLLFVWVAIFCARVRLFFSCFFSQYQ
jgi:hypothetical protein